MRKGSLLNSEILTVIANMGHTDKICIGDCGLPVPDGVKKIDISLLAGQPSFLYTLEALLTEYKAEKYVLAEEIKANNPAVEKEVKQLLAGVDGEYISHQQFKERLKDVKAVIRTGEATPYANIILESAVIF